jgi:hypothetical protein
MITARLWSDWPSNDCEVVCTLRHWPTSRNPTSTRLMARLARRRASEKPRRAASSEARTARSDSSRMTRIARRESSLKLPIALRESNGMPSHSHPRRRNASLRTAARLLNMRTPNATTAAM